MKINHIGIVVQDIDEYIANSFYTKNSKIIFDKIQNNYLYFLDNGETKIELIQPFNQESTVYNFLQKTGGGLHHICYEVNNVEEIDKIIKANNMIKVYGPTRAIAFDNRQIVFAMNRNRELIEFVEGGGGS